MFDKLNYIELSGEMYPIKCDLCVLEKIQEEYHDLSEFENGIRGFIPNRDENGDIIINEEGMMVGSSVTPNIKMLNHALVWMVREGIEIEREENGKEWPDFTDKELIRKANLSPKELGAVLHREFNRCFERKNQKTTQGDRKAKTTKE